MPIEDIYALTNVEDHNAAIKYLLPFWGKYRKIEQIVKETPQECFLSKYKKIVEVLEDGNKFIL